MTDPAWGPGWPNCQDEKWVTIGHVDGVPDNVFDVARAHRDVVELARLLIEESARRGYVFKDGQCWGAVCRAIRGSTTTPSNHSWGLALDFNSARNPLGSDPDHSDIPRWMPKLWSTYAWRWGGTFSSRPDPMHFEFAGSPADAKHFTAQAKHDLGTEVEDVRLDKYLFGQQQYRERYKELGKDPGPPPDAMSDPDAREGWIGARFAATNPRKSA